MSNLVLLKECIIYAVYLYSSNDEIYCRNRFGSVGISCRIEKKKMCEPVVVIILDLERNSTEGTWRVLYDIIFRYLRFDL